MLTCGSGNARDRARASMAGLFARAGAAPAGIGETEVQVQ